MINVFVSYLDKHGNLKKEGYECSSPKEACRILNNHPQKGKIIKEGKIVVRPNTNMYILNRSFCSNFYYTTNWGDILGYADTLEESFEMAQCTEDAFAALDNLPFTEKK